MKISTKLEILNLEVIHWNIKLETGIYINSGLGINLLNN